MDAASAPPLRHSALQHLAADGRTAPELQAKSRHLHLGSLGRYVQLGEQTSANGRFMRKESADIQHKSSSRMTQPGYANDNSKKSYGY